MGHGSCRCRCHWRSTHVWGRALVWTTRRRTTVVNSASGTAVGAWSGMQRRSGALMCRGGDRLRHFRWHDSRKAEACWHNEHRGIGHPRYGQQVVQNCSNRSSKRHLCQRGISWWAVVGLHGWRAWGRYRLLYLRLAAGICDYLGLFEVVKVVHVILVDGAALSCVSYSCASGAAKTQEAMCLDSGSWDNTHRERRCRC